MAIRHGKSDLFPWSDGDETWPDLDGLLGGWWQPATTGHPAPLFDHARGQSATGDTGGSSTPVVALFGGPDSGTITASGSSGTSSGSSSGGAGAAVSSGATAGLVINVSYDASVQSAPAGFTAGVQA